MNGLWLSGLEFRFKKFGEPVALETLSLGQSESAFLAETKRSDEGSMSYFTRTPNRANLKKINNLMMKWKLFLRIGSEGFLLRTSSALSGLKFERRDSFAILSRWLTTINWTITELSGWFLSEIVCASGRTSDEVIFTMDEYWWARTMRTGGEVDD